MFSKQSQHENLHTLGRIGQLETRLAVDKNELRQAQALRYKVFHQEMSAIPTAMDRLLKRDIDQFDKHCDHLLVIDNQSNSSKIVGTCRLLRGENLSDIDGYYTQSEFDISALLKQNETARFLELGRSCILSECRSKRTMELLWHGIWAYAVQHKIDIMFGCASFEGTNPSEFSESFSWLDENAQLDPRELCPAIAKNSVSLSCFQVDNVDIRKAMATMPTILKGYLRLGAHIGSDAVIDHQFGTTDVLVVLKVAEINPRYLTHFGKDASRFAA